MNEQKHQLRVALLNNPKFIECVFNTSFSNMIEYIGDDNICTKNIPPVNKFIAKYLNDLIDTIIKDAEER